jgi:hypothetical protein
LFSITRFRSLLTLFTLEQISPVFATLTKSTPGYTPSQFSQRQCSLLSPVESILTNSPRRKSFIPHTYEKQGGGVSSSGTIPSPAPTHYSPLTIHPPHPPSHCVPTHTGARFIPASVQTTETCPPSVVSKQMSGPKAPNQLVADRYSLIARVWARKAPRV